MTETTNTLRLTFLNSENKKSNLSFPDAAANLDKVAVKGAMDVISKEGVFEKEEVDLYKVPHSASYIERTVTTVFDDSKTTAGEQAQSRSLTSNH